MKPRPVFLRLPEHRVRQRGAGWCCDEAAGAPFDPDRPPARVRSGRSSSAFPSSARSGRFADEAFGPDIQALSAVRKCRGQLGLDSMPFARRGIAQSFGKRSSDRYETSLRTASTTSRVAVQSLAFNKPRRKMSRRSASSQRGSSGSSRRRGMRSSYGRSGGRSIPIEPERTSVESRLKPIILRDSFPVTL